MPALIFGLQCAAYIERLDPSIYWMGMHHSRLVEARRERRAAIPVIDPEGAAVRLGPFGRVLHRHRLRLDRDRRAAGQVGAGDAPHRSRARARTALGYDADDPDWLRWNYATVVWGIATAHELYHPNPLRGKKIDRYYGEFVRVGHALGGTDLPTTKAETLDCLHSYLPKLALTHGAAMSTGPNLAGPTRAARRRFRLGDPRHAAEVGPPQLVMHRHPNPSKRNAPGVSVGRHQRDSLRRRARSPNSARRRSPGEGRDVGCRTRCRRMCRAPTRCAAARRPSRWPDPAHVGQVAVGNAPFTRSRLTVPTLVSSVGVVRDTREAAAIGEVVRRLTAAYSDVPADKVAAAVQNALARFELSRIREFVPLFVERRARAELAQLGPTVTWTSELPRICRARACRKSDHRRSC